ncbi:D-amino acid dehydrogenase [Verminephrobacter eiseniae]|uniref:D-amino-acid dehydrogenase n=1 Tax=Verminephrobacter eiseniae (strain EF01-2) TaxID=391735 RepID=A1WJE6_VEREI|nr:D-amino acid dehydrogenase [Verminephrobacter eiseniae]ABM57753.1 D-amino-acid dehydrogenase [Verminephrobacter eiseniae EF01-2]MCW5283365.1 D-amino acid dehydrogenase [Verminephrobacter eiseniae]MCW5301074.1 D-amino acid dehydrogenase [Verminephrobacter eiseniae]MCW8182020.1 D-amino acid dehydrogenase [Verminephrobacter eiseniae]MCW8192668.1 D-amino acid dehydrogenase [Verminephrobacter eiseniae]
MHIVVIGAGIIGMTTAYALRRDGHKVSVLDARCGPGRLTSKANGAQLSYSYVAPLAEPAVLPRLLSWLVRKDSPLRLRLRADPAQWRWGLRFLAACTRTCSQKSTGELLALGTRSRERMHLLVAQERLAFHFASSGKLLIYQDPQAYRAALVQLAYLATLGCQQHALDRAACLKHEPALADIGARIAGGIFTPTEDVGDCLALCRELQRVLSSEAMPVQFHFGTEAHRLRVEKARVVALETSAGTLDADAYVIANGVGAQTLARRIGIDPLIYPLKGYSLTYQLTERSSAPVTSISDVQNKVVYARLGNRLRVAGMVEIGARSLDMDPQSVAALRQQVRDYLPRLHAAAAPEAWTGLRPARPDGKPLIGATPYGNLWLNVGHGALGFTLAAGSAELLADRIAGRPSAHIPAEMFTL